MSLIEQVRARKLLIIMVLSYVILLVYPLTFFWGDLYSLENNLATADLFRSSLIFIFDSVFLLFLIIVPFGLLLIGVVKRRLKVLRMMSSILILALLITTPVFYSTIYLNSQPLREKPLANKVIVITFDGTRADAFWKHATFIINHKNESTWARRIVCTYPTVTYPNHISLFTGTWPQIHGTESNPTEYKSIQFMLRVYREPSAEDIFEVAERYDIVTAVFSAPTTLASILGGMKTQRFTGGDGETMMSKAINFIESNKAIIEDHGLLAWIHLVDPDDAMHMYGTDSIQYFSTIRAMANLVGELYEKIHDLGWEDDTVIIVTADHGGIGRGHYGVWPPLVAETPLWMWGVPFKKNFELGGGRIIDIAPTIAYILGIPAPAQAKGIVLYRAFDEDYIANVRGESVNVDELAYSALNKALWDEAMEIYFWGLLTLTMAWIILIELGYLLKNVKVLAKEEKRRKSS